jgi:hypothetical protein
MGIPGLCLGRYRCDNVLAEPRVSDETLSEDGSRDLA